MRLTSYASPADHPAAVYLHGLNVWAVRVRGRAAAVSAASARGWTAFRVLGDWFVSDQKPDQAKARELLGRLARRSPGEGGMVPNPANLSRADDAIAVVPDQQAIAYKGFTVKMRPSQFLALCPQRALPPSKRLEDAVRSGLPIGPPFLEVAWDESAKRWQVYGHEGRGRAIAILKHFGDEPIEIDVLPQYLRARDLTPEMRRAPFVKDVRSNPVVGDVVKCDGRCCEAEVPAIAFAQAGWQRRRDESGEVIFLCPSCYDDYLETKIQGFRHNPPVTPPPPPGAVGDRLPQGGGRRRRPLKKCVLCGALADTSGLCFRCKHPEARGKPRS